MENSCLTSRPHPQTNSSEGRNRTCDILVNSQALLPLNYLGISIEPPAGVEPATSRLQGACSATELWGQNTNAGAGLQGSFRKRYRPIRLHQISPRRGEVESHASAFEPSSRIELEPPVYETDARPSCCKGRSSGRRGSNPPESAWHADAAPSGLVRRKENPSRFSNAELENSSASHRCRDDRAHDRRPGSRIPVVSRRGERNRTSSPVVPNDVPYRWATPRERLHVRGSPGNRTLITGLRDQYITVMLATRSRATPWNRTRTSRVSAERADQLRKSDKVRSRYMPRSRHHHRLFGCHRPVFTAPALVELVDSREKQTAFRSRPRIRTLIARVRVACPAVGRASITL